ncbi:MAG: DUF1015 domain-containing protein [Eubacteriales bacterium]|nr:DUF1015 domain-containing protein [Eubacteriales bacterium]
MITIKPFKAIRPKDEFVSNVASLPYDVFSREEAKKYVEEKPFTFLRIDRPETNFSTNIDMYSDEVYEKALFLLNEWITKGILIEDNEKGFFIYEQTLFLGEEAHTQTGLVCLSSTDDYINNRIKKHENTVNEKQKDRYNHIKKLNAHTGPIFLTYKQKDEITNEINNIKINSEPLYELNTNNPKTKTRVWGVYDKSIISFLKNAFLNIECTYIADGHHRAKSAINVGLEKKDNEEAQYFLSIIFPSNELQILPYNRYVCDLNGYTLDEFLNKIKEVANIEIINIKKENDFKVENKNEIIMYINNTFYKLKFLKKVISKNQGDIINSLDTTILQDYILDKILGIKDPKEDKRIEFIGGIKENTYLLDKVRNNGGVCFFLYPVNINELLQVADENKLMPPKSTWFEPKLLSGLFIHKF